MWKLVFVIVGFFVSPATADAYSANKVFFDFLRNGRFRVTVNYTVPELREFRESYVEFTSKREAEEFYWDLVRGGDFYPSEPKKRRFTKPKLQANPW